MNHEGHVVLIVAPDAFHLGWMGATLRLFHIAEAFQRLRFSVVLLAGRMTNPSSQRDIDAEFPGLVFRTCHTGNYPQLLEDFGFLRRIWRAGWKLQGSEVYWSKLHWGWAERLDIIDLKDRFVKRNVHPTLVWGVSAGYLDGAVAAERIARASDVPWVLELHDPPRRAGLGEDCEAIKTRFGQMLANAAKVVVTARSYGLDIAESYCLSGKKWETVYLSYEKKDFLYEPIRTEVFSLVYVGSLVGKRSLSILVRALQRAFQHYPEMRKTFRFELAGVGRGFEEISRLSAKYGLNDSIRLKGMISRDEANRLVHSATVTVLQEPPSVYQVHGKLFGYLKEGKPVLGLMPKDCEVTEILRKAGLGFIHEPRDVEGICTTLVRLWNAWQRDEQIVKPNWSFIEQFSTERLPDKLATVVSGLMNSPR